MQTIDPNGSARLSRRGLLGAGLALTAAGAARAAAPPLRGATIIEGRLQRLTPNAWAYIQKEGAGQSNLSVSNCGVVAGPDSMLVIDTTGGPEHARRFIAAVRAQVGNLPIDKVVITHEHPDHIVGLPQLAGADIISQDETRVQMQKLVGSPAPAYWAGNPAWARPDDKYEVVVPNVTFKDRMSVWYGDTQVDFYWPGPAHTSGDALVLLPKEKILWMGDIAFFGVTPLNGSGFIGQWINVCNEIIADPGVQTIVPGHGPVGGKAELIEMTGYLELLFNEGRKKFDAGVSPGRAAAEVDLGKYATWTDPDRIANNMARLYTEFRGTIAADQDRAATAAAVAEYNQIKYGR